LRHRGARTKLAAVFGRDEEEPPPESRLGATHPAAEEPATGPSEGLILLLFTILTLAVSAFVLLGEESDAVDDPKEKAARGEVRGLDELSLIREPNLRKVIAKVSAGEHPLVANIRIAPERVDVTASNADGSEQKILKFDPALGVEEVDFGSSSGDEQPASKIDARAPERMLRAVAERTGQPPDAVDYVTMSFNGAGPATWFLALERGPARDRQWLAAADGGDLRRSGEIAPSVQRRNERIQGRIKRQQERAQRIFDQRNRCLQKAADAEAVSRCIERYAP
jgi:hypothetical protein